jgi:Ca2+-binding EF-hand superfamily protein|tara:strand:- start:522 stop:677 length:156 start_codon:yes stop_codon:yes gene_type:complete
MGFLYMAHNMDEKDVVNLRKLFIKIDANKNGQITAEELQDYFNNNKESLKM